MSDGGEGRRPVRGRPSLAHNSLTPKHSSWFGVLKSKSQGRPPLRAVPSSVKTRRSSIESSSGTIAHNPTRIVSYGSRRGFDGGPSSLHRAGDGPQGGTSLALTFQHTEP